METHNKIRNLLVTYVRTRLPIMAELLDISDPVTQLHILGNLREMNTKVHLGTFIDLSNRVGSKLTGNSING